MALLFSKEIIMAVEKELASARKSVQIISAYCKLDSIKKLARHIDSSVDDKRLMVRFRLSDIVAGSTDFDILDYCLCNGWKVYIRFDLHIKTYIVDDKRGIVGSANATRSGLTNPINGNQELAVLVSLEEHDQIRISKLFDEAIPVDDVLLNKLRQQIEDNKSLEKPKHLQWGKDILDLFNPKVDTLFSHELPAREKYLSGEYIDFLDETFDGDLEKIAAKFRWSNAYLWLKTTISENGNEMYFGALSAALHSALVEDPKPYRKDVKILLANMLSLIERWGTDEFIIDRPNYSQRVRLVSKAQ